MEAWNCELSDVTLWAWMLYQDKGVLPFAGGALDQPEWVMKTFTQYDMWKRFAELEIDQMRLEDGG